MSKFFKKKIKSVLIFLLQYYYKMVTLNNNKRIIGEFQKFNFKKTNIINLTNNKKIKFINVNHLTNYRLKTFFTKEPETISWINNFKKNSVFWDIGSNIGLYSIYASKVNDCKTFSFEPSVYNLEILSRNIFLNNLEEKISIIPNPLGINSTIDYFYMNNPEYSSALSSFSHKYDQNDKFMNTNFKYKILGINGSDFINKLNLPKPDYIKIDVDGAEHLIIKGFDNNVFENLSEILIEINEKLSSKLDLIETILSKKNFVLESKYYFDDKTQYNGIWKRKN